MLQALGAVTLSSQTALDLPDITAGSGTTFQSPIVDIGELQPAPGVASPFQFSIVGAQGGVGTFASVAVDAPLSSILMPELREQNAVILTDAASYGIANGFILDTLRLTTPFEAIYMNNQYSRPINNIGIQLFAPQYSFSLEQYFYGMHTDTFVVQYNQPAEINDDLATGDIAGASFLRDFERLARDGDLMPTPSFDQFGMPLSFGPWLQPRPPGWSDILPGSLLVPPVNLLAGDKVWQLVSRPGGLWIDVVPQRAH
jgi:hypothetical protein